jgi:hypothetical protein
LIFRTNHWAELNINVILSNSNFAIFLSSSGRLQVIANREQLKTRFTSHVPNLTALIQFLEKVYFIWNYILDWWNMNSKFRKETILGKSLYLKTQFGKLMKKFIWNLNSVLNIFRNLLIHFWSPLTNFFSNHI